MGRAVEVIERDIEDLLPKNHDLRAFAEELDRVDGQMVDEPVVGKRLDAQYKCICMNCLDWQELKNFPEKDKIFDYEIDPEGGATSTYLGCCTEQRSLECSRFHSCSPMC